MLYVRLVKLRGASSANPAPRQWRQMRGRVGGEAHAMAKTLARTLPHLRHSAAVSTAAFARGVRGSTWPRWSPLLDRARAAAAAAALWESTEAPDILAALSATGCCQTVKAISERLAHWLLAVHEQWSCGQGCMGRGATLRRQHARLNATQTVEHGRPSAPRVLRLLGQDACCVAKTPALLNGVAAACRADNRTVSVTLSRSRPPTSSAECR